MEHTLWTALGASSLAALVTAIGIYTIRHFEAWGRQYSIYFVCFAAGSLKIVNPTGVRIRTDSNRARRNKRRD